MRGLGRHRAVGLMSQKHSYAIRDSPPCDVERKAYLADERETESEWCYAGCGDFVHQLKHTQYEASCTLLKRPDLFILASLRTSTLVSGSFFFLN